MSVLALVRHGQARPFEEESDRLTELGERQARARCEVASGGVEQAAAAQAEAQATLRAAMRRGWVQPIRPRRPNAWHRLQMPPPNPNFHHPKRRACCGCAPI